MGNGHIEVLKNNFKIFRYHYMWPKKGESLNSFTYKIKVSLFLLSNFPIWIGSFLDLIFVILHDDPLPYEEIIDCMVIVSSGVGIFYIFLTFIWNRMEIDNLVKSLGDFQHFGVPTNFDLINRNIEQFVAFVYVYCSVGCFYAAVHAPFHKSNCEEEKLRDGKCGFVGPVWTPFPTNTFPLYEIVILVQWYCAHNLSAVSITISSLVASTIEHLISRIKHLKEIMQDIFIIPEFQLRKQRLKICILYHSDIINLANNINGCFRTMMFMHLTLTSLILCMMGYKVVTVFSTIDLAHMVGWFIAFSIQCYAGQHLIDESASISFAIYNSNWYDGEVSLQNDIKTIIRRAQEPLTLQAGPFGVISYSALQAVVKTTYSYLTLLTKTT